MSTKTSIKRVALVAVSALGFGLLSVMPARATDTISESALEFADTGTSVTINSISPIRPGASCFRIDATVETGTTLADGKQFLVALTASNQPIGSNVYFSLNCSTTTTNTTALTFESDPDTPQDNTIAGSEKFILGRKPGSTTAARVQFFGRVTTAGSYTLVVTASEGVTGALAATEPVSTSRAVTTTGVPTSVVITPLSASAVAGANAGTDVAIEVKDADGNKTALIATESLTLSASGSGTLVFGKLGSTSTTKLLATDIVASNAFGSARAIYPATFTGTAATTATLTVTGSDALAATVKESKAVTLTALSGTITGTNTAALDWTALSTGYDASSASAATSNVSTLASSWSLTVTGGTADAAEVYSAWFDDTSGSVTGIPGAVYTSPLTVASTGKVSFTLTGPIALGANFTVGYDDDLTTSRTSSDLDDSIVLTGANPSLSASTPKFAATNYTTTTAGSIEITVTVEDQFGDAASGQVVSFTSAGRNDIVTPKNVLTNADGEATYTLTDASTSTTLLVDTVTASVSGGLSGSVKVNYLTSFTPALTLTVPTASTAINTTKASSGTASVSIVVKNGTVAVQGVKVVWSTTTTDAAITTAADVSYTDATGKATTTIYSKKTGDVNITATVGSTVATGVVPFKNATTDARVISIVESAGTVTATVKDAYGNGVPGVSVDFSRTGAGYFGNGLGSTTVNTSAAGTAEVIVTGAATVTATINKDVYTQSDDLAGYMGNVATATANAGVPAGVNTVSVATNGAANPIADAANAASDAAAEAIDAANAATDAANLAAEAADAATVAAEEARDAADAATAAVEELAASFNSLVASVKAQITTLANTVAKIAKKVRA
jgi:hypothetical protein